MRLFVAVNFDTETKGRIIAIQDKIKKQAARGNFSRPENLHLTLVFIGETDAALVPLITQIIKNSLTRRRKDAEIENTNDSSAPLRLCVRSFPLSVTFSQTGCFRHSGKELWWIGGAGDGLGFLTELRRRISHGLETAGIPFDKRPFKAHITLGREIRPSSPIVLPEVKITVPVERVSLMKSEHIGGVLTYTELFGTNSGIFYEKER
jgi:2'-5' RNA ligase